MESIGTILKNAREAKGYTIEQVARETNITKRYVSALEEEDTSAFPGETYFTGFLRNYAEFLGEDPDRLVSIFKNLQIQEQAPPMEELLKPRRSIKVPLIIGLAAFVLLAVGIVWFVVIPRQNPEGREADQASARPAAAETGSSAEPEATGVAGSGQGNVYSFTDEVLERSFSVGDTIAVHLGGSSYPLRILSAGDVVVLNYGSEEIELPLETVHTFDLSGNGQNDLKIVARQITADGEGVVLYLDKYVESVDPLILAADAPVSAVSPATGAAEQTPAVSSLPASTAILGQAGSASRAAREQIILEESQPRAFDLDVVFRGLCLVRYVTDNNAREEKYFHQGDVLKIEAGRELRLWISNAGSFTARIGSNSLSLGNPGEISTRLIRWERNDSTGQYQLKLIPVY